MPSDARSAILRAAELLFAERGTHAVSLREVNRAADQRNSMAVQYHFTDRDGLLRAILERHGRDVALRRAALLDHWESNGGDVRQLVGALVTPLVAKLSDPDGGSAYLQVAADLLNRSDRIIEEGDPVYTLLHDELGSIDRWSELVVPLMPKQAVGHPFHRRFATIRFVHLEVARRARAESSGDHALFTSHLVDLMVAFLGAPLSSQTKGLLAKRPKRSTG